MANRERGEVPIDFGDDEYILKFDLNALEELEDYFEGDLSKALDLQNAGRPVRALRQILYLGLKHKHPEITVEDTGRLAGDCPGVTFQERMQYITGKFQEALGVAQLPEGGPKKKGPVTTGKRSSD